MYKVTARGSLSFIGNTNTKEVHNLRNERSSCSLEDVLLFGRAVAFTPDTLAQAKTEGFELCQHCRGNQPLIASTR